MSNLAGGEGKSSVTAGLFATTGRIAEPAVPARITLCWRRGLSCDGCGEPPDPVFGSTSSSLPLPAFQRRRVQDQSVSRPPLMAFRQILGDRHSFRVHEQQTVA